MKIEVQQYQDEKGHSPFGVWFDGLDSITAARIVTSITRMQNGNFSNSKSVGSEVFENKLDFGPGYRIYYAMEDELLIILLAGGTKKRQSKDISEAKVAWINYKKIIERRLMMALTREFKKTVFERAQRDPIFRNALLTESLNEFLSGDLETAKLMLRDYINASVAFHNLAEKLNKNDKSLQRMLGPDGNPTTSNFFALLHGIQEIEGIKIEASCKSFMKRNTSRISKKGIATNKKPLLKKSAHR